ncbi:protein phosphatase 2C domain-containing protein [Jiangella gansuensis]|uniref:protein phosphatase 2C domain-containing protein n=1 Tax=Jiangella gansuensis TaxID=281473 RepID=UPI001B7FDA2D|nr:protein phosphatase 2C domain-containing protein [Jiangella gansuensis]
MAGYTRIATQAGHSERDNEDFAGVTEFTAVVVDGAGKPPGTATGCGHGVAWFSHTLGAAFIDRLSDPSSPMTQALADAIDHVAGRHGSSCDLAHPDTPSATVTAVRERDDHLEWLVLADSPLIIDLDGGQRVVYDDRLDRVHARHPGEPYGTYRNRDGGFWVASVDPRAADQALTGRVSRSQVRAVALLTDGASRPADRFGLLAWSELLEVVATHGPDELIRRVRSAEGCDPHGRRWPRTKAHDDATVVYRRYGARPPAQPVSGRAADQAT